MDINLLPWREEIFEYNKKVFSRLMSSAIILAGIVLVFIYYLFFAQVFYTESYTQALEQAKLNLVSNLTAYLNQKKVQKEVAARLLTLQQLEFNRFDTVRLLNAIVKITPKGVYLSKFSRDGNNILISGSANSNIQVAELMEAIHVSPNVETKSLEKVEKTEGDKLIVTHFDLQVELTLPPLSSENAEDTEKSSPPAASVPIKNPIETIRQQREEQMKKIQEQGKS